MIISRRFAADGSLVRAGALVLIVAIGAVAAPAADRFGFYAPPGGVYANASFEREETVAVSVTVEHEGVAVPDWFIAVGPGGAAAFEPREMSQGASTLSYQLSAAAPPSVSVLKAPPAVLTSENVITSSDFGSVAASPQLVTFTFYLGIAAGQFVAAGEYTDSVSVQLYTGRFADPGTHVLADSVTLGVTGRMAQLVDLYADRAPGIRSMDLTVVESDRLIATINERSNAAAGYTVTVTSANLESDLTGAPGPFFARVGGGATLDYTLTYDGSPVGPWSAGSAVVVDSGSITVPEWVSRELRISYSGSPSLAAGDYEDRLIITISAK